MICSGPWQKPIMNRLEQLFAVIITTGLVVGNFLLFTPWRNGHDPRRSTGSSSTSPAEVPLEPYTSETP